MKRAALISILSALLAAKAEIDELERQNPHGAALLRDSTHGHDRFDARGSCAIELEIRIAAAAGRALDPVRPLIIDHFQILLRSSQDEAIRSLRNRGVKERHLREEAEFDHLVVQAHARLNRWKFLKITRAAHIDEALAVIRTLVDRISPPEPNTNHNRS